jgi:hypothetical protein
VTHPRKEESIPLQVRSAGCPEAQADGVPCASLGRDCEECQRAVAIHDQAVHDGRAEDRIDPLSHERTVT